jgi:hypothetical protein
MKIPVPTDRVNSFHLNDGQPQTTENDLGTEIEIEIDENAKILNDLLDNYCYGDRRCEAATWRRVGFRSKDGIKSDVLKCLRCQKLMLRHVVRD